MTNALRASAQRPQKTRIGQLFLKLEIAPAVLVFNPFDQGIDFLFVNHLYNIAINLYNVKRYICI